MLYILTDLFYLNILSSELHQETTPQVGVPESESSEVNKNEQYFSIDATYPVVKRVYFLLP